MFFFIFLQANITRQEFNDAYSEYLRAVEEEELKNLYEEEDEEEAEEDKINSSFRFYSNKVSGQIGGQSYINSTKKLS